MGFVFGAIYLRTGRLRYSIALHMAINLLGGVYVSEILKRIDLDALMAEPVAYLMQNPAPLLMLLLYFGFLVLCFLASPIAAALLYKFLLPRKSDSPLSFADWRRALLLNPVVWLFLCVVALMFVA